MMWLLEVSVRNEPVVAGWERGGIDGHAAR
jgi:hypothetical protein